MRQDDTPIPKAREFTTQQWLGRAMLSAGVALAALLLASLAASDPGPHPWPRWVPIVSGILAALFALFTATALAAWRDANDPATAYTRGHDAIHTSDHTIGDHDTSKDHLG